MTTLRNMARLLGTAEDGTWAIAPTSMGMLGDLAENLAPADRIEAEMHGFTCAEALVQGYRMGPTYCVLHKGRPKGIFGWTGEGAIWSLWTPLDRHEQRIVLKWSGLCIDAMVKDAGKRLMNSVWEGNTLSRRWVALTRRFDIDAAATVRDTLGRPYINFRTKEPARV